MYDTDDIEKIKSLSKEEISNILSQFKVSDIEDLIVRLNEVGKND